MAFTAIVAPSKFKNEENFWQEVEEAFEQLEGLLLLPVENRAQAETNTFGPGLGRKANKMFPMVVTYRQTDNRKQLEYFHLSGIKMIDVVQQHIERKRITPEFLMDWAQLSFCAGFVANSAYAMGNDLNDIRAGLKGGAAVSVDDRRIWFSKIYKRALETSPKYQKNSFSKKSIRPDIEDRIEALIRDIILNPDAYSDCPADWFKGFLSDNALKATYRQKALSQKRILEDYAKRSSIGIPRTNMKIP